MLPRTLGPYRFLDLLGEGGQACVYRARHEGLGRLVALKVLHGRFAEEDEILRFRREMRLAASLKHPHLVTVLDGDTEGGSPYIAMELVEGETVAQLSKRRGALPWREAFAIGQAVADGLAHLHARGIVHRDIKPGNVLLSSNGAVKLADFGLARQLDATMLTPPASIVGTFQFMAPEVLLGKPATPDSDLWSLGCLLHTLLTGRPLIEGASGPEWVQRLIANDYRSPREISPEVPSDASAAVMRLLRREPEKRAPAAGALAAHLQQLLRQPDTTVPPAQLPFEARKPRLRWRTPAAAVVLLLVLAAASAFREPRPPAAYERALTHERRGDLEEAEHAYRACVAEAPDWVPAMRALALLLARRGAHAEAEDLARRALERGRASEVYGHIVLARVLSLATRSSEAEAILREAIRSHPRDSELLVHLGEILQRSGRVAFAEDAYRATLDLEPHHRWALALLGDVLRSTGRAHESEAVLRRLLALDGRHVGALSGLGGLARDAGRLEESERMLREACRLAPSDAVSRASLAATLLAAGRHADALEACRLTVTLDPGSVTGHVLMSQTLVGLDRIEEALASCARAVVLDPRSSPLRRQLAALYKQLGRRSEADAELRAAIEAAPADLGPVRERAILAEERAEWSTAVALNRSLLARAPGDRDAVYRLARALEKLDRFDEAAAAMVRLPVLPGQPAGR